MSQLYNSLLSARQSVPTEVLIYVTKYGLLYVSSAKMVCNMPNQSCSFPPSLPLHRLTEARKFVAVQRKMVKASSSSPTTLLHFPKSITAVLLMLAVSAARNAAVGRRSDMITAAGIRRQSRAREGLPLPSSRGGKCCRG